MSTALVWFRNDLRLHDHEPLTKAIEKHDFLIPIYCFDEKDYGKTDFGFRKTDSFRAKFTIESVSNLKNKLLELGSNLIVRYGNPTTEIQKICEKITVDEVYCYKDIHSEEMKTQKDVEANFKGKVHYYFGSTLFHVNDLPHSYQETPMVFTQFRKGVEKKSFVRRPFPTPKSMPEIPKIETGTIPTLKDLGLEEVERDKRAAISCKGGEDEATNRLQHYFYETEELSKYKEKRNGLIGANYSSKFSLWLWNGCISPRKVYWEVQRYEKEVKKNQSTYWLIFELIWRDYFKFIALKHGNAIFKLKGIKEEDYHWETDEEKFAKWAEGKTGIPFIDANMRELNKTGFMSNRGRQNVASFLVKELELDWRMGAEYFESKLIDYDVASNYGNWMYIAGVGNDPRDRYFNIISQAKRYDPKGEYVKLWLPELKELDTTFVHHPWTRSEGLFNEVEIDYPKPLVIPSYWEKHY